MAEIIQNPFVIRDIFSERNITLKPDDALVISKASVKLNLRTIHFSPVSTDQKPECYLIKVGWWIAVKRDSLPFCLADHRLRQFAAYGPGVRGPAFDHQLRKPLQRARTAR